MSKSTSRVPWLRLLGALNALALVALLSQPQPASAGGVDACEIGAEGCRCITDSGTPFLPDGCYNDSNPVFQCHAGSQCDEPE